ncbi:tyramine oxidase subunit B [Leucobacter allii]|uniref:Tyramine oxidase subunit B n=1 Tax=Leucobacter allii TaxID=2932247 RepID=A0ABY4FMP4_9MICO|nr:tyramine oxidase subunit B [Leucobacter allii]UOQ57553.1 tyramine oxidase subunit B [Leucobacter allii]UOR02001.1 tyramine oxidase subunit B [Leucobacter allii]
MTTSPADPRIDFLYLNEADMIRAGVTDMAACVDTMTDMLGLFAAGDYRMAGTENNSHGAQVFFPAEETFPGMPVDGPDRRFMAMPAYLGGDYQTAGCKWYGSNVANKQRGLPRSILMFTLNDKDTGAPLAYMSANLLSAYRTGAIPGVGARSLAREDARVVGIVGPGPMNRTSLESFLAVRPGIDTVKVAGRSQAGVDAFLAWAGERFPGLRVTQVADMEAAVRDSDIVSIAVPSDMGSEHYPRVRDAWVKPGAFICCSAHLAVDEELVLRSRHVADARKIYQAWAEELPEPAHEVVGIWGIHLVDRVRDGRMRPEQFEDMGEIINGLTPGRTDDDEIFIYSVGGMPVEDVAWATRVYRNALRDGIGTKLNLWETPALA